MNLKSLQTYVILLPTILITIAFPYLIMTYFSINLGDVDTLAYIGALLSGILTLWGVIYTIKHSDLSLNTTLEYEKQNKFIESFPTKLEALLEIEMLLEDMLKEFNTCLSDISTNSLLEFRKRFIKLLIQESSKVDGNIYTPIKHIDNEVIDMRNNIAHGVDTISVNEFKKQLHSDIVKALNFTKSYQSKLGSKFNELSKII